VFVIYVSVYMKSKRQNLRINDVSVSCILHVIVICLKKVNEGALG